MTETALPLPADPSSADRPTFDALPLSPEIRRAVDDMGFVHPSPVQLAVYQPAVAARDLVVQARTGTGKTAAFGLPIVDRLVDPKLDKPQVLVLAPTRELALQISRELSNLTRHKPISCVAIYGGAAMQPQVDALRAGAQIIVGTPGRVLDHFERGTLSRGHLRILVLDESDEMLSMGFLPQITRIMEQLPRQRQTLLFSATLPPDVKRIAETRLEEPLFITLSGDHVGALSIQHFVYRSRGAKPDELVQVIKAEDPESAIVFCNTRDQTKRIATALKRSGYTADWLNADLAQGDREKVMQATRDGKLRFLVATDVAARGIDISHLTHVINADFPESTENYVHRTGRTGRAGRTGTAISLIAPQDVGNLYMLRLTYKIFPVERELPSLRELSSRREADLISRLSDEFEGAVASEDLGLARRVLGSDAVEVIVAGLLKERLALEAVATLERGTGAPNERTSEAALEDDRKKHKKDKKKDRKRKDRHDDKVDRDKPVYEKKLERHGAEQASLERSPVPHADDDLGAEPVTFTREAATQAEHSTGRGSSLAAPGLEVVSARQILGGSVEELLSDRAGESREPAPADSGNSDTARIFVSVGKRDNVSAQTLRDVLQAEAIHPDDIDFVTVKDNHTFLGVASDLVDSVLTVLNGRAMGSAVARAEVARPRRR